MNAGQFAPAGIVSTSDSNDSDLPPSCRIPDYYVEPTEVRRCSCGTRLSRYNSDALCFACKEADAPMRRANAGNLPKGVAKNGNKYAAQRQINGQRIHLGLFNTPRKAHEAWRRARPVAESR